MEGSIVLDVDRNDRQGIMGSILCNSWMQVWTNNFCRKLKFLITIEATYLGE